ncbi:MAG: hypothetical protein AB2L24_15200 [Mangrovibacterium sp.]
MKKLTIILFLFLISCVSTEKLFSTIETSEYENYGYSKENPILIGEYNHWQKNTDLALYYLSKLSYKGNPLRMIMHATVDKPSEQPRKKESIPLRYGTPSSLGGKFLDLYVVVPKGMTDTLNLYFDVEIKGTIKVPKGLEFNINQTNNIYR